MGPYILRRLISTFGVMTLVAVFVFMLLRISPGDPAAIIAGDTATPEMIAAIRQKLGLSEPIVFQFTSWVGRIVRGDFGVSIFSERPVTQLIVQRMEPTLSLAALTIAVSVAIGVVAGVYAAWKPSGIVNRSLTVFSALGFAVPVFVAGYFLIYWFAISLRLLPVQGYVAMSEGIGLWLRQLVLPVVTLSIGYIALIARMTRASMLEIIGEDFMRTAAAKGLGERTIVFKHALRNAGVPVLTVIGIGIASLISGVVITETVYNIPGIGRLTVDAINNRDYPIIQAVLLIFSGIYVIINLMIDLSYCLVDPRIRY